MGSDDFVKLDSPIHSNAQTEGNDCLESQTQETNLSTFNEKIDDANHIEREDFTDGSINDAHNVYAKEGSQHVQNMVLENDDFIPQQTTLPEKVGLIDSFSTLERLDESEFSRNIISTNSIINASVTKLVVDENPVAGFKRARTTYNDQNPSVRVVYNCLTRESKKKLVELMQQWSQWQTKHQSSFSVPGDVALESGEDTYFAALHVGSGSTNAVSFWFDNQGGKENIGDPVQLDGDMVPLYDRKFTLGLATIDGSTNPESSGVQALEASRCFNCGSYSHAMKECPKPRDNVAISNARKQRGSKRNQNSGPQSQNRYYQKSSGKFDDLKAGVLGPETRECLGIKELDPPPWLHRMRQLGYPPGYLDNVEEVQSSGITIFADEEVDTECEEGELPEKADPTPQKTRMTVEFPGINAPIPENADNWLWGISHNSHNQNSYPNSNRPPESHRGNYYNHIESTDRRDDGTPGSANGFAAFSRPLYSPRYSSQDHNSISSPHLGRSLSDRSWPSPILYGSSPLHSPQSPYPSSSHSWQSPQYHPYANIDHRSHENSYRSSSDARERDQHRHSHHRHYPRR